MDDARANILEGGITMEKVYAYIYKNTRTGDELKTKVYCPPIGQKVKNLFTGKMVVFTVDFIYQGCVQEERKNV